MKADKFLRQNEANLWTQLCTPPLADAFVTREQLAGDGTQYGKVTENSLDVSPNGQERRKVMGDQKVSGFPFF